MLVGPVFGREAVTAPRRTRFYVARAGYAAVLLILMCTAWLVLTGTQVVRDLGDVARFGSILFQILAPLQLALAVFFAAVTCASAVSQEKDRRTLVLLLLTNLTSFELVVGKLLASLLTVLTLVAAAIPLFMLALMLGGVSLAQIVAAFAVTFASVIAAGSLGSTLALWREKTFQALAMTALALVIWIVVWEAVQLGTFGTLWGDIPVTSWATALSPWRAILSAASPDAGSGALGQLTGPLGGYVLFAIALAVGLNTIAVLRVRPWNTGSAIHEPVPGDTLAETTAPALATVATSAESADDFDAHLEKEALAHNLPVAEQRTPAPATVTTKKRYRSVWDNPVLWREIRTWAYGRKVMLVRFIYIILAALSLLALWSMVHSPQGLLRTEAALTLIPLFVLSLVLVNAQAVTALTTERDGKALDLILVTDLTPAEIVFGKLGGIFYNTKEIILLPLLLCSYLWWVGELSLENLVYLCGGLLVMDIFVAMLGVHCGMIYENSRTAIGASLGTVFFLFVGIATCMRLMVAFSGSFQVQLQPFLAFMVGGGVGLYLTLGARNPSPAIALAAILCPFATFYAITSFLLNYTLGVFLVTALTYGFTTAAMLIPAIYEFDVATGRTQAGED